MQNTQYFELNMYNGEWYIYRWTSDYHKQIFRRICRDAANPRLSLNWFDVLQAKDAIKEMKKESGDHLH